MENKERWKLHIYNSGLRIIVFEGQLFIIITANTSNIQHKIQNEKQLKNPESNKCVHQTNFISKWQQLLFTTKVTKILCSLWLSHSCAWDMMFSKAEDLWKATIMSWKASSVEFAHSLSRAGRTEIRSRLLIDLFVRQPCHCNTCYSGAPNLY